MYSLRLARWSEMLNCDRKINQQKAQHVDTNDDDDDDDDACQDSTRAKLARNKQSYHAVVHNGFASKLNCPQCPHPLTLPPPQR